MNIEGLIKYGLCLYCMCSLDESAQNAIEPREKSHKFYHMHGGERAEFQWPQKGNGIMNWKLTSTQNLYTSVGFIATVFIIAKTWVTKMSFNKGMYKQTVINLEDGIVLNNKKKWAVKPWKDIEEP